MRRILDEKYQYAPITSIRLPKQQMKALRKIANEQGCTVSDIIRECVEERLKDVECAETETAIDGQISVFDPA